MARVIYVDASRRWRREIYEEPLERMFERNTRLTQSCRERVRVTAYRDDGELSDIAGVDPSQLRALVKFGFYFYCLMYFMLKSAWSIYLGFPVIV
ncbi:hypothetical protein OESDEN_20266 [Oesophagostomum dentatum]|uniref:Uncharacterized protein n=1 Tax=Oesophagostomum dentatum TaxID=61180 RepID=A0A0B1S570_OESDE|nr:hypothetical protein OESDEN_20266 [Oesophagostomum dentatum]